MSPCALHLTGYGPSVYTWSVRLALAETGAAYRFTDVDPFTDQGQTALAGLHPFGRVPVLDHGGFRIWETAAILDYVDATFGGGRMTPEAPAARARMRQVISIVDAYGYWPMVRQVCSQVVFAPMEGAVPDTADIERGLARAAPVLAALDQIAAEGLVLAPGAMSLADVHLLPMVDYFALAPQGRAALGRTRALEHWYARLCARGTVQATRPVLVNNEGGS